MKKYPLFQSQLGVFLECMTYPDTTQYNLPHHVKMDLGEDVKVLSDTWKRLICATPTLLAGWEGDSLAVAGGEYVRRYPYQIHDRGGSVRLYQRGIRAPL